MSNTHYQVMPIGRVAIDSGGFSIVVAEPYRPALEGLAGFSHLNILWWCHHLDDPVYREMVVADKPYKAGPDQIGIFATRSPARPNPIAITAVPVLGLDVASGVVQIAYIDAEPDTPVLDIKPYLPAVDRIKETTSPAWCSGWPSWYEDSATFDWGAVFENAQ
ncbi:MAG: SAM-dependent methyltransferase [bacterium]|nr:SAM-dependent methyltransferase [bacterium]